MKMLIFTLTSILIATLPCTSNPLNILHKNKLDFKDKFQLHQTLAKRAAIFKDSEKLNIRLKRDFSNSVRNSRNNLQRPLENIAAISERMFDSNDPSISKTSAGEDINKFMEKSIFPSANDNFITERMLVPLDGSKSFALNSASPSVSPQSKNNNFNLNLNNGNSKANINGGSEGGVSQTTDDAGNANNMASLVNSGKGVSSNFNNENSNKDKIALPAVSGDPPSINKAQGLSINANEKKGKSEGLSISSGLGSDTSLANSSKSKVGISNNNLSNSINADDSNASKGNSSNEVSIDNGKGPISGGGTSLGSGTGAGLSSNKLGINANNGDQSVLVNSESDNISSLDKNTKIDLNNNNKNSNSNLVGNSVIANADKEKDFAEISSDTDQINNSNKGKNVAVPKDVSISSNVNDVNKDISPEKGKQVLNDGNDDTKVKANGSLSDEPSTAVSVSSNGGGGIASVSSGSSGAALPMLGPVSTKPLNNLIENIGNNIKNNLFGSAGNGNTAISIANENGGTAAVKNDSSGFVLNVNNQKNKPEELGKSPALGNGALAVSSSNGSPAEKETEIERPKKETDIPEKGVGNGALAVSSGNTEPPKSENEEKLPNTPNIAKFPATNDNPKTYTSQDGNIIVKIGKNNYVTSIIFKDPSALDHGAGEIPKQVSNLPIASSSISVNDGNKDSSNDKSKNISPFKAVSNTAINNENNYDNNNTPNTVVANANNNNRKENPSNIVTSTSVNSGQNNPGGVSVSATSGSGLNAAKALSTGLSLANGNIGLNMGDGGISVTLKDGIRSENRLNTNLQKNKDDANEVTTKSKMFPNEDDNTVAQIKKNSIMDAPKNQIKDEHQNSNDIETSNNMTGAANVNDLSNKDKIVGGKGIKTLNGNSGTIPSISKDNGNSITTSDDTINNSAKTFNKETLADSSVNNDANFKGITVNGNGNGNFFQIADYKNGSKAFASPDGKTKLFVGNNAIISTTDIQGGGSSSFSYVQGENGKVVTPNFGGEENPSSSLGAITNPSIINSTAPVNNDNFNNQHGNKHPSRFYNSIDNKIVVEIGNDSLIKSVSFQELEGPPTSHKNVKLDYKNAAIQPNQKLFKSKNGKMTVVIENDDHIKFLNFFETSNVNNNYTNMDQNNENKEVSGHNNKLNGESDNTKTDKLNSQVNVNNNDRNAVVLSGTGDGGAALNNDKSHKNNNIDNNHIGNNIDGSGVNSNNGVTMGPTNGKSVTFETTGGENGPKKPINNPNVSAGTSVSDGGPGISVSSGGVGLMPPNGGSGIAFSSGVGGLSASNGVNGASVSSGAGGVSASSGISVAGGGAGIAATNDLGNSKNGNALSINSGAASGVGMNSGAGNGVSSVTSSVGDGTKSSGIVSSGVTGATANGVGSGISVSNIGQNMNLKVGDNSKQLKGQGGGPKVELTDRGLNVELRKSV